MMALTAPLRECARDELDAAARITYRLEQTFTYTYDEPVERLRQRLVVVPPPRHADVHLRLHSVLVDGATARRLVRRDVAGNTVVHVRADRVERRIEFRLTAVLERVTADGPVLLPAAVLRDARLLQPTRLTQPDDALTDWAGQLRRRGESAERTAERVCAAVHERMSYRFGVTSTRTTAPQALAGGIGVCQDFAHVMLALCRLLDVPSRYVSGHLIGQGGTHAWVEVVVPDGAGATAVAFDPCNGRPAGRGHLTVATGRDYADVAPTAGTYVGPPTGRLTSTRRLGVVDLAA